MINVEKYPDQFAVALCSEAKQAFDDFCSNHECRTCPAYWPGPCEMSWLMLTPFEATINQLKPRAQAHQEPQIETRDETPVYDEIPMVIRDNLDDPLN